MKNMKRLFMVMVLMLIATGLFAQETADKRAMRIDDYGRWRSIASSSISDNGEWMTYAYVTPEADDTLYVKSLKSDKEYMIPGGSNPIFSDDNQWIAFVVNVPVREKKKLEKGKKPVPTEVQLLNLEKGAKQSWKNTGRAAGGFRFRMGGPVARSTNIAPFNFSKGSAYFAVKKAKVDPKAKHKGVDYILRNLATGLEKHLGSVSNGKFNKPGTHFAYTVDAADNSANGLYLIDLASDVHRTLDSDTLTYAQMAWAKEGGALAVLKGEKKKGFKQSENILIAYESVAADAKPKVLSSIVPKNMIISENGQLIWSMDLTKLFFGVKEQEADPEKKKDAKPVANVDIFHWNDDRIQTVQEKQAGRDGRFTYLSVFLLENEKFIRLADDRMRNIVITEDGNWGIGFDDKDYISDWKENRADLYRVNTNDGKRNLIQKEQKRTYGLSPDSKHFLMWRDGHMWDYNITENRQSNITIKSEISFVNAEWDYPSTKPAYGVVGWSKDGANVILSHRYDLYRQPLDGSASRNLTNGAGAKDEIRFRYIKTDPEEKFIDLSKPMLLSAYGQWTKKAGFYELKKGKLKELVYTDNVYGYPKKAATNNIYMYTIESPLEFPNIHISSDLKKTRNITDANPWQSEYKWGNNILVDYTNKAGVRLQAVLMVPDSYKEGDKYPMLVDFYEKNSHNLNRYSRLVYRDTPMFYKYVSNGYLVLLPDVHFNTRTTHSDMLDCVEASVKKVIEMGYADPEKVGLHGHSFSGGGGSFIATRSKMFAAIVAGAAPINLAGEFNILFHGSGNNNHSYDIYGQGRYGTNPFDDFELYREQSPITHVRTMDTPLLYLHGTKDGSVEYLQGMEFYNALRFLGKNVIFVSYPGQDHHASKLENKIDFQTRMEQFYEHYLKGKPAPDWMINGVPFLKKKK